LPFTGLDVPDAEGVPLGAQSCPQPVVDDVVVEVEELETAVPPLAEGELVAVELDVDGRLAVTVAVLVWVVGVDEVVELVTVTDPVPVPVPVSVVGPLPELEPQPAATATTTSAATIRDTKRKAPSRSGLLQALARFAHERDGLGEDDGHHRAQLLGLLLGRPLDVDAIDRRHRQIDGQLDRVVGPGETLSALHLLGELPEPTLQVIRVSEQATESASFHDPHGSHLGGGRFGGGRRARQSSHLSGQTGKHLG
jgi:hypothetical protein